MDLTVIHVNCNTSLTMTTNANDSSERINSAMARTLKVRAEAVIQITEAQKQHTRRIWYRKYSHRRRKKPFAFELILSDDSSSIASSA